ncbi:MAG: adenylosuccinate lyase [Haloarculaceae archaeon]
MYHTSGWLFEDAFGTERMREVFSEERYVEAFLEAEAALARAEAEVGLVPEAAAEEITEKATLEYVDLAEVREIIEEIDLFTVAIITAWKDQVGENGEYIHWGATSQDISDTAFMFTVREGYELVMDELYAIREAMADVASEYRGTPTIGRTHHVHALPMTFGLRVASWLDELDRGIERMEQLQDRLFSLQLFGAVGTLASLGEPGLEVQERFAEETGLSVPDTAWFTARDRYAELLSTMAHVGGTLARASREILMLNREEINEANEPIPEGLIGSSTMPHKLNPIKSERNLGLAALLRGHASAMNEFQEGMDERDAGLWYAEYAVVPESFLYLSALLRNARETVEGLEVNEEEMMENLSLHGQLVTSEAVMMALAEETGRQTAHEIVHEHAIAALRGEGSFREHLLSDDRVTDVLSREDIEALTVPEEYVGCSEAFVERTVEK